MRAQINRLKKIAGKYCSLTTEYPERTKILFALMTLTTVTLVQLSRCFYSLISSIDNYYRLCYNFFEIDGCVKAKGINDMESIDNLSKWLMIISSSDAKMVLNDSEVELWDSISKEDKEKYISDLILRPVIFENPEIIFNWYFRSKWIEALKTVQENDNIVVYEVGPGGSDVIPQAIDKTFRHTDTRYITSNLNKELTAIFKAKTEGLGIDIRVIEDDAVNMNEVIPDGSVDVVVFEHSVNDVIETILAEKNGIDTINSDWMKILDSITDIENREYHAGTMEQNAKPEFLDLIKSCMKILKPGGFIVCAHYQFQYNLDIGLDPELNENYLNIARKWIRGENIGEEVFFDGFNPRWWMFLRK